MTGSEHMLHAGGKASALSSFSLEEQKEIEQSPQRWCGGSEVQRTPLWSCDSASEHTQHLTDAMELSSFSVVSASRTSLEPAPRSGCCSCKLARCGMAPRSGLVTRSWRTFSVRRASDMLRANAERARQNAPAAFAEDLEGVISGHVSNIQGYEKPFVSRGRRRLTTMTEEDSFF